MLADQDDGAPEVRVAEIRPGDEKVASERLHHVNDTWPALLAIRPKTPGQGAPRPYNPAMTTSREIRLAARPSGVPQPSDFELAEVDLPEPGDGEVLIRNACVSVDPYMRGRMNDARSYVPPFQLGEVLSGGAVGQVVVSHNDEWP